MPSPDPRRAGVVERYDPDLVGVIRDARGKGYTFDPDELAAGLRERLSAGQRVRFEVRPNGRALEAVQIALDDVSAALEAAAAEVLRHKRERREAPAAPADPFADGASVVHPTHGRGRVILATRNSVSVRFSHGRVRLFQRADLEAEFSRAPAPVPAPAEPGPALASVGAFMEALRDRTFDAFAREGVQTDGLYRYEPARPAGAAGPLPGLDPRLRDAFAAEGIEAFYGHQIEAWEALRNNRSLVLSTPTASGKTAAFTPAILHHLLNDRTASALYVFPLVALAADQTRKLEALMARLPEADQLPLGALTSNEAKERKAAVMRRNNAVIATTPDTLHYRLLPNGFGNWETFFRNLRYIVLDEAHVYKGAFGSNVANIARRAVARAFRLSGRAPQIVIASATVRDPLGLAAQLTGYKPGAFEVVGQSAAAQPPRHLLITRESVADLCAELMAVEVADAGTGRRRPARALVFTRSIQAAKTGSARLREALARHGRAELAATVYDFYSDKADKADVFARLRNGELRCVFSTSALMAGIDIGGLDVVIVDGFPGLVADARQMFGRAGRVSEGAAIFVAREGEPFDDFYVDNPDLLFAGPPEPVIANPENPLLLASHLLCAASVGADVFTREGPLTDAAARLFGEAGKAAIGALESAGQLARSEAGIRFGGASPHSVWPLSDLRATNDAHPLALRTDDGRELEKKRRALAYRDTHPDAIFLHDGAKYRVTRFPRANAGEDAILCAPVADTGVWTQGIEEFSVSVEKALALEKAGERYAIGLGEATVATTVSAYRRFHTRQLMRCVNRACRHESPNLGLRRCPVCGRAMRARTVDEAEPAPVSIPDGYDLRVALKTQAAWLAPAPGLKTSFERDFRPRWPERAPAPRPDYAAAVTGAMDALLKAFPEQAACDRDDVAGFWDKDAGRIYLYDTFPNGLGLAADFARDPGPYLALALEYLERCGCSDSGCPVCLLAFRSRQQGTRSKLAARYALRTLLGLDLTEVLGDVSRDTASRR